MRSARQAARDRIQSCIHSVTADDLHLKILNIVSDNVGMSLDIRIFSSVWGGIETAVKQEIESPLHKELQEYWRDG